MGAGFGAVVQDAPPRERYAGPRLGELRRAYVDGCQHQASGRHAEAVASFRAALSYAPDFADALLNLCCSLLALKRHAEAVYAGAGAVDLRPEDPASHFNFGMALLAAGRAGEAVRALGAAARLGPGEAKHHVGLSRALLAAGREGESVDTLASAIDNNPGSVTLLLEMGSRLIALSQFEPAAGASFAALEREPDNATAHANLARALHGLRRDSAALESAVTAVRLAPGSEYTLTTLSIVLGSQGLYQQALDVLCVASRVSPEAFEWRANGALVLAGLGRHDEAEALGREALALAPQSPEVRHNLAVLLLASGKMTAESWDLFETRLQFEPGFRALAALPRWRGEDAAGRTIVLHSEQGFGDTIQFCRYASLVADRGAKVILLVQPQLVRLLQGLPGCDQVMPTGGELPPHDLFCPLLSVPAALRTTLDSIPGGVPYIVPSPETVARWRLPGNPALQVGLAWAGNPKFTQDRARSIAPGLLHPLCEISGVRLHGLQMPAASGETLPVQDRMQEVRDLADTAGIIAELDLVICVDSAVAHLAAAMGKEVWLLNRHAGCWRWLRDREDSPWYPSMRIYRQPRPGDWADVIRRVVRDLTRRAEARQFLPASSPSSVKPALMVT